MEYSIYPRTVEGEIQQLKDLYQDWQGGELVNPSDQEEFDDVMAQLGWDVDGFDR